MGKYSYSISNVEGDIITKDSYRPSKMMHIVQMGHLRVKIKKAEKVLPNPNWVLGNHSHSYYFEFHIIPRGRGLIAIEDNQFTVRDGCFYVTGPNVKHRQESDKLYPMEEYCVQVELDTVDSVNHSDHIQKNEVADMIDSFSKIYPYPFQDSYGIRNKFDEMFDDVENKSFGYITNFQNNIIKILINIYRAICDKSTHMKSLRLHDDKNHDCRVEKIFNFISSNYMKNISISDLEKNLFLGKKQINRIMQKEWGKSFREYLQLCRYNEAKIMIEETSIPVYEIAERCGFSSANNLYQTFKKFNCPPPSELRKK